MTLTLSFLGMVALHSGAAQAQPKPNPAEIFRAVCLGGSGTFAEGELRPAEVMELPWSLRSGLSHFDHRAPRAQRFGSPGSGTRFFRIGSDDAYLMTATGSSGPCAVFWEGGHWDEVRDALNGWIAVPATSFLRTRGGDVWMEGEFDAHMLAVAGYQGWIMMRAEAVDRLESRKNED